MIMGEDKFYYIEEEIRRGIRKALKATCLDYKLSQSMDGQFVIDIDDSDFSGYGNTYAGKYKRIKIDRINSGITRKSGLVFNVEEGNGKIRTNSLQMSIDTWAKEFRTKEDGEKLFWMFMRYTSDAKALQKYQRHFWSECEREVAFDEDDKDYWQAVQKIMNGWSMGDSSLCACLGVDKVAPTVFVDPVTETLYSFNVIPISWRRYIVIKFICNPSTSEEGKRLRGKYMVCDTDFPPSHPYNWPFNDIDDEPEYSIKEIYDAVVQRLITNLLKQFQAE